MIHNSNMSVLTLTPDDNISLHQVFCPFNFLPAREKLVIRHILCVSQRSNLSKF
nr:MAG TPA: hypothetical protein [Bacteriophage sp.]